MATLNANNLTLADWTKRLEPNGGVTTTIAELLSQTNEILEDMVMIEGNTSTGHRVVVRTGLPTVYWRALNMGVPTSKSTTVQVDEACGMLEAFSEVDKDLAELNGDVGKFRLSEDYAFLEAMNQTQIQTLFYGSVATTPESYSGFATRYSSLSAGNAANILDAGGTQTDNTSIWLIVWGDQSVFCPFPKGSKAGLIHEDLGLETVNNSDGSRLRAYRTRYQWKNGLVVKDWRCAVRACNIDVSNLVTESSAADIVKLMSRMQDRVFNLRVGKPAFYMNRTVYSMLRIQALNKSSAALAIEDALTQFGTPYKMMTFNGIPIRKVDQLLNTEARVT